jgi:cellulose synthase/poly-beta-1,6-N-acetylglucosamine synthase-like glycosyltransferase/peptidoglycan/xylan/chitin deacetylase (PgdA/CDA1 family)
MTMAQTPVDRVRRRLAKVRFRPAAIPIVLLFLAFAALLTYENYLNASFKPDGTLQGPGATSAVPPNIVNGGPIVDTTHNEPISYDLPPKTIVLTFDDGPDPVWTPQILDALKRNEVNATFFVIGSEVARNPAIVARLVADGNEVGVHTFTHPDMTQLSPTMRSLEITQTQMAIVGATGIKTDLLRFPYSSGVDSLDNRTWPLVLEVGKQGYISVFSDIDTRDWERPGVDEIVKAATPKNGKSGVLLMHDAGGERSETLEALDVLLPELKDQGYQFLTVTQALRREQQLVATDPATAADLAASPPDNVADFAERWRGHMLVGSVWFADNMFDWLGYAVLVVGLLLVVRTVIMFLLAGRHARRRRSKAWSWGPPVTRPVTVVVPAYNEQENIAAAVRSIACGDYPEIEVIVVDDGSTDRTAEIVSGLDLPNVRLITIPNGGKPNALNVGIAAATHGLIVMVDGDTVFEKDSLRRLVQPFADPRVGGVAGNVKVSNRRGLIGKWQHIEYVIGFNLDRRLFELMQCMPTIPGAIGGFRRQALRDVGGVSDRTLAEDTDLTMAINRAGWRVVYEENARAWTEAPATFPQLWKQRYRWSYGTMQAMWIHRGAVREHGASGRFGRIGLPFLAAFGVIFPLLAPVVDFLTFYGVIVQGRAEATIAWCLMLALQMVTAVVAFRLDKESLVPLWSLPLQQFVYRQLIYVILLRSMMSAFAGIALRWQKLHRTGAAAAYHSRTAMEPDEEPGLAALAGAQAAASTEGNDERTGAVATLAR